ncbi:MAG TPA: hypothetical protein VM101_10130 [Flavitalea sp.]|nr:hypothetical protein [Flavitalea sp.]
MKKFKLTVKIIAIVITVSVAALAILILYPENLFGRHTVYKHVSLYSDKPLNNYSPVIEEATTIIQTSELFDPHHHYDIFVTGENMYKIIVAKTIGPAMARSIDNNILLNAEVDFSENKIFNAYSKRNLEEIAHEMIHCLQLHKYGIWVFNPLHQPPTWITEGYPEFIATLKQRQAP